MVPALYTWDFLSGFNRWPRVHTVILFIKAGLNIKNFLICEKNITVGATPIQLQQFLGSHTSDLF